MNTLYSPTGNGVLTAYVPSGFKVASSPAPIVVFMKVTMPWLTGFPSNVTFPETSPTGTFLAPPQPADATNVITRTVANSDARRRRADLSSMVGSDQEARARPAAAFEEG